MPSNSSPSNLESFLHSITPVVPPRPLSKNLLQVDNNKEKVEYFFLEDIWQVYDEWSAYGVGVPVMLSSGETVVQYYTPQLSAIQLYTNRKKRGDIAEVLSDDLSETNDFISFSNDNSSKAWDTASNPSIVHGSSWQVRKWDPLADLYFQYSETISPYWRLPFADKIVEFVEISPELSSLKSIELSPASWMAVAWSPIYHIPFKEKVEDLSTHFLTFHTLSSHFQESNIDFAQAKSKSKSHKNISLPPFGLSTLKMQGDVWINRNSGDYEKLIDLHCAADSWLKQLGVYNQDFDYYKQKNLEAGSIFK